ncbi:helix-turn-helix domain-containing protein [Actinomyces qiguomingii]|uniref:AlbA family DNA-binding domain-containing protein n=1 Tax=Actinomyces qiguomingii TaxID=2057800 RepID=UPI000CA01F83|nr:ATP-binding protein [Actinomyces qiguomingii]
MFIRRTAWNTAATDQLRIIGTDQQMLEVKSGIGKDIRATLSAMSNSAGGTILIGLDEAQGFAPVPGLDATHARKRLVSRCEQMTPVVRPVIEVVLIEGAPVVVATIPEIEPCHKPCYVTDQGQYGASYTRSGDGDRRLTQYEVERLPEEHTQSRRDEESVTEAGLGNLDDDALAAFISNQRAVRPKTFANSDDGRCP